MNQDTPSRAFHDFSKYDPEGIQKSAGPLDWSKQPKSIKIVNTNDRVDLVPYLPFTKSPFEDEPIQRGDVDETSLLGRLSRILYFSYGATAFAQSNQEVVYFRSAPSAGGLYPADINIAIRMVDGLDDGIYHYEVQDHSLAKVWDGDYWSTIEHCCLGHSSIRDSQVVLFISSVFERGTWRYKDRALRRIFLDIGHILGNVSLVSRVEGMQDYHLGAFIDDGLNEMLLFEEDKESVMVTIPLVKKSTAGDKHDHNWTFPSNAEDVNVEPPYLRFHKASKIVNKDDAVGNGNNEKEARDDYRGYPIPMPHDSMTLSGRLYDTIVSRRSARHFSRNVVSFSQMAMLLNYAYGTKDDVKSLMEAPHLMYPDILKTYIAVNHVDGLEQGLYQFDSDSGDLYVMRRGDFSDRVQFLCLGQELASDAAFVVFHFADLNQVYKKGGDRGYRYIKLDAGHIGQRLNLASVAMGLGASGIGGYFDDMGNELFYLPTELSLLYLTCLGSIQ